MSKLTILHVSDVHFGCTDHLGEQGQITNALIKAAHLHVKEDKDGTRPGILVFSGDLADKGTEDQLMQGEAWLSRLLKPWPECLLFIVPGNHDLQRPKPHSSEQTDSLARRAAASLNEKDYTRQRAALAEARNLQAFFSWHLEAKQEKRLPLISDWTPSTLGCYHRTTIGSIAVNLVGINTATSSCDDDDKGRLVADLYALNLQRQAADPTKELMVAVSHHPIAIHRGGERWLARWNNKVLAERLSQQGGPHLYMHGHLHRQSGTSMSNNEGQRAVVLAAGAAYQGTRYQKQFAFYDIHLAERRIKPWVFEYHSNNGRWFPHPHRSEPFSPQTLPEPQADAIDNNPPSRVNLPTPALNNESITELQILKTAYARSVACVRRLVSDLYPGDQATRLSFSRIESKTVVHANGDGEVIDKLTLRAGKYPIHFWVTTINVEKDGDPIPYLANINFEVRDIEGKSSVVFLPSKDEERQKEVAVFFLPHIRPREARTIQISYRWPAYANRLVRGEPVDFSWAYDSASRHSRALINFQVETHRDLGEVTCTEKSTRDPLAHFRKTKTAEGHTRWIYSSPRAALDGKAYLITLKKLSSNH